MIDAAILIVLALAVGGAVAWLVLLIDETVEQVPYDDA